MTLAAAALESFAPEHPADCEQPHERRIVDALPHSGPGTLDRDAVRERFDGATPDR